ncbi:hypothetical protein ACIOHE_26285 [Streptomyces sp. NPDC087851]|uniref:hypothetical protein n=1 Tax=Streptomyces sp. NPDC087851 TaxID=3365810 RepID=UPI0038304EC1
MKLVRDNVPGMYPLAHRYRRATPTERPLLLRLKLAEELGEVLSAPTRGRTLEELGDLLDAADALRAASGWSVAEVDEVRAAKRERLGAFQEGWMVE